MRQIAAAKFKEQCLALLDRVGAEVIVITKRGKPVAKLIPIRTESASLIGRFEGRIKIKGDVLSTGRHERGAPRSASDPRPALLVVDGASTHR